MGVSADTWCTVPMVTGLGADIAAETMRRAGLRPVVREQARDDDGDSPASLVLLCVVRGTAQATAEEAVPSLAGRLVLRCGPS